MSELIGCKALEVIEQSSVRDLELLKVAYHEAAHAAVDWNLGFGVHWIRVDRLRHCGKVQPAIGPRDRAARIAYAVGSVAGLASLFYLDSNPRSEYLARSLVDMYRAQGLLQPPQSYTHGEQLGVAVNLTCRVRGLLETPELRKQIQSLAKPLMRDGHMFQAQIHSRLERHPATQEARRRCRSFVASLETDVDTVIAAAKGYAPEFSWPRDIR